MANRPLSMQKTRQILLFLERGISQRSIEKEVGVSRKTIAVYLQKFLDTGQDFGDLLKLPDERLDHLLGLAKFCNTPVILGQMFSLKNNR